MGTSVCWRAAGGHSYVCSKSHCVAVRRILKKCAQTSASVHQVDILSFGRVLQCAAVCCSVLQCGTSFKYELKYLSASSRYRVAKTHRMP